MVYLYLYLAMVVGSVCTIIAMTAMRRGAKHNVGKFGWLFLTLLTPPVGLILFLILGGKKISAEHDRRDMVQLPESGEDDSDIDNSIVDIGVARGLPHASQANRLQLLTTPQEMRKSLIELIESATDRLFLHSFILNDDVLGREIVDRLCAKAREGVTVRLMVDGFGSFPLPNEMLQQLRDAGGDATRFKPVKKLSRFAYLNFRNHRKLIVVDGARALLGGANFVDYEMTNDPDDETWIDYCLRIEGTCARQIEAVFLSDWNFTTNQGLEDSSTQMTVSSGRSQIGARRPDETAVQLVPVGPDGPTEILDDLWLSAINRAEKRVWIVTPYFVPPPAAMRSLVMALRRGVVVRIIVPRSSDMAPADYARLDYLHDLEELGAEILQHPSKMVHAKMILIDEMVAYCGSANFDMRSCFLNYELIVGIFDGAKIGELADWYDGLAQHCETGPFDHTWWRRALGIATRMVAEEL